jgi:hypothetical protein
MMARLVTKTEALEERLAHGGNVRIEDVYLAVGSGLPKEKLLKPSDWRAGYFRTQVQRKLVIADLMEHFGKRMKDGSEPTRDFYELKVLLEGLEIDLEAFSDSTRNEANTAEGTTLKKFKLTIKRALLLKEKTENGVESMKALERRLEDAGYEPEFETALKEVRARQLQAALQRTGGRVDTDSSLPRTGGGRK